jgi:hypothetical protein
MNIGFSGGILTLTSLISTEVSRFDVAFFIGLFSAFGYLVRSLAPPGITWVYNQRGDDFLCTLLQILTGCSLGINLVRFVGSIVYIKKKQFGY